MTGGWIGLALGALALTGWLRLDAIQRLKLHGRVASATVVDWSCSRAFSIVDSLRYRSPYEYLSLARYAFVADGRRIELRSHLAFSCPNTPPESLTYARRDPTVTDLGTAEEAGLLVVGLPLLAIVLLRSGFLRVREGALAVRLLRRGRLIVASCENLALPGQAPAIVTSAGVDGKQVLVITPAPFIVGDRQSLLVGRGPRVVAWDLLPFVPQVEPGGALVVPSIKSAFPWTLAPVATLVAFALLWIAW